SFRLIAPMRVSSTSGASLPTQFCGNKFLQTLNGATGASDMAGNAARVAVERCGSCRDTNAEMGDAKKRSACWRSPAMPLVIRYWLLDQYAKRSRAVLQLPAPFFKNTRARLRPAVAGLRRGRRGRAGSLILF